MNQSSRFINRTRYLQKRILFVDNEESIVTISEQMLKKLGYEVETRTDSLEALELFKSDPDHFNLVISDIGMPKMSGDIFARELIRIRADIPVILATGYSEYIDEKRAREIGVKNYITKPILMDKLDKAIHDVLDKE